MADFSEVELAILDVLVAVVGTEIVASPERREGMDAVFAELRTGHLSAGRRAGAAFIERIRALTTDLNSDPGNLAALQLRSK